MASTDAPLSAEAIEQFVRDGFVALPEAVPPDLVAGMAAILWRDAGCDPGAAATWTRPVVRLGYYGAPPFRAAVNTPRLTAALDQLIGRGRWLPRADLGSFVLRFPDPEPPGDDGWHVDASFPGNDPADFFGYRINAASKGRALLMLVLLTDTGPDDAPTRLRVGSHRTVARLLAPEGEAGLSFMGLAERLGATEGCPLAHATGTAGTVYLCHPFLAHAGQSHRGSRPRILAQPPVLPLGTPDPAAGPSPVERAISEALAEA